ncbi:MAG: hypothetical protein AAFV33_09470 [Chloroflexota bacterium]
MSVNRLDRDRRDVDLNDYLSEKTRPSLAHVTDVIEEPTAIYDNDRLVMFYDVLPLDCSDIIEALKTVNYISNTRSQGMKTRSAIFGWMPRVAIRTDYCRAAAMASNQPDQHQVIMQYAERVAEYYATNNPLLHGKHMEMTDDVLEDYRIGETPFTSGIANYNNALDYHFDTGNFEGVWSCMLAFSDGIRGGELVVPEYDVAFRFQQNSVFMFDGQDILHGVAPIIRAMRGAYRFTVVYYSLKQMWNCLPITEELIRIRQLRTEREERLAARVRNALDGDGS